MQGAGGRGWGGWSGSGDTGRAEAGGVLAGKAGWLKEKRKQGVGVQPAEM